MKTLSSGLALLLAGIALASGCGQSQAGGDTQTNWLKTCASDSDCAGLECVCGRCARACSAAEDCAGTPVASGCEAQDSAGALALCAGSAPSGVCLSTCTADGDCAGEQTCVGGACLPVTGAGEGSTGAAALDFCRRWVERHCAYVEECGCGAMAADRCGAEFGTICEPQGFIGSLAGAVDSGDLVFDAAAGEALLARYDEPDPSCVEETFRNLRLNSLEAYSLAGTFRGTHELGAACTLPVGYKGGISDCSEGLCAPDEAGSGRCIGLGALGDPCDASGNHNLTSATTVLCFDVRPPDSDGEYESAFDSLSCVPSTPGAATLVCSRALQDGQPCDADEACASARCSASAPNVGECAPKLDDGDVCSSSHDCSSGACDPTTQRCSAPLADGAACSYTDSACASGSCHDTDDGAGGTCGPAPTALIGEACSTDDQCVTGTCRTGLCFADICGDYLN